MESAKLNIDEISSKLTVSIQPYVSEDGWIRMLVRDKKVITCDFKGLLTPEDFVKKFKFKDFGVSDNEKTMKTEESWYYPNVELTPLICSNKAGGAYLDSSLINTNTLLANIFNGKTPTGTAWSQDYI